MVSFPIKVRSLTDATIYLWELGARLGGGVLKCLRSDWCFLQGHPISIGVTTYIKEMGWDSLWNICTYANEYGEMVTVDNFYLLRLSFSSFLLSFFPFESFT
jgi:hypothetical protein